MRFIFLIGLLVGALSGRAQKTLLHEYNDYFGHNLKLYDNHSFEFNWQFEIYGSWSVGTWAIDENILTLQIVPIFDTLSKDSSSQSLEKDVLVLAQTATPKRLNLDEYKLTLSATSRQNKIPPSRRYVIDSNKLIIINDDGRLRIKKIRGYQTRKRYRPWYLKVKKKNKT